jgi:DNA polymerase II small subunit
MDATIQKKKIINYLMGNDVLVSLELVDCFSNQDFLNKICNLIDSNVEFNLILSSIKSYTSLNEKATSSNNINESKTNSLNNKNTISTTNLSGLEIIKPSIISSEVIAEQSSSNVSNIKLLHKPAPLPNKREVGHFVSYFSSRYKQLEAILKNRTDLANILSISRLKAKKDRDQVSIIGIVRTKDLTKNNNIILSVEDLTGEIKVLINKTNQELLETAKNIVEDEVIGVVGVNGDNILFSNCIIQPDIPLDKEFKKHDVEEYAVFLSDIHVGSKYFLKEEFNKFLSWIRCETGNEKQRTIAKKVKYIFVAGDIVDGVGIYPNQENELEIFDIHDQYKAAAELFSKIPSNITIIIGPGNHDAVRLAEPQPELSTTYASALYNLKNVIQVPNPAFLNICSSDSFSGFDILLYHGYSFDHYVANVDLIRLGGGYDRADLIMKFMLKRRHLAPTYKSTLFIPEIDYDGLVIDKIPDFFVTGHIHKTAVSSYRNVTLICGSCWQAKTTFQEKVGHHPEPARVPIVNLKTRKMSILNFEL